MCKATTRPVTFTSDVGLTLQRLCDWNSYHGWAFEDHKGKLSVEWLWTEDVEAEGYLENFRRHRLRRTIMAWWFEQCTQCGSHGCEFHCMGTEPLPLLNSLVQQIDQITCWVFDYLHVLFPCGAVSSLLVGLCLSGLITTVPYIVLGFWQIKISNSINVEILWDAVSSMSSPVDILLLLRT